MSPSRRNLLLLVALLLVWGGAFLLRPAGAPVRPAPANAGRAPGRAAAPPHLKTELLEAPRPALPAEMRNIFGSPPPPPAPPGGAGAASGASGAAAALTPPPPPPDPFIEEARQLRYVGFLKSGEGTLAFIVRGQEVHTLGVGSLLQGRYRVQAVTETDLLLASPDGGKQVRLLIAPAGTQPSAQAGAPASSSRFQPPGFPGLQPQAPGVPQAPGLRLQAPGVPQAPGLQPQAPGGVPQAPGLQPQAPGLQPQAPGLQPQAPGLQPQAPAGLQSPSATEGAPGPAPTEGAPGMEAPPPVPQPSRMQPFRSRRQIPQSSPEQGDQP